MNLSHGEFRALVSKAFRGAGYSWGLTEDAACAASRYAEVSQRAGDAVVNVLRAADGNDPSIGGCSERWQPTVTAHCPIRLGTALADADPLNAVAGAASDAVGTVSESDAADDARSIVIGDVLEPVLAAALLPQGRRIEWSSGGCGSGPDGVRVDGTVLDGPVPCRVLSVRSGGEASEPRTDEAKLRRVVLSSEVLAVLDEFAHRTYAPATDASRAAGAGGADD